MIRRSWNGSTVHLHITMVMSGAAKKEKVKGPDLCRYSANVI
jgi:hypothetical protein